MIVLLTGGSGCGKSTYAEKLIAALSEDRRIYIATMRVFDEESVRRVARHRAQRAHMRFRTVEAFENLGAVEMEKGSNVLLEDLPNLLANEMFGGGDWHRIVPDLKNLAEKCENLVIVTNDVFAEGRDYDEMTRAYQEHLSEIHAAAVEMADYVAEVVYSIPVALKGDRICV